MVNRETSDAAADFIRSKIREIVKDPKIAELLTPSGYPVGATRICADTGDYATFNHDDVTLVFAAGVGAYREISESVAAGGYEGFRMTVGPIVRS
jgi:cyclohexanone monooxygenase